MHRIYTTVRRDLRHVKIYTRCCGICYDYSRQSHRDPRHNEHTTHYHAPYTLCAIYVCALLPPPPPSHHRSQVPQLEAQQLRTAATEDAQFKAFEAQLAREKAVSLKIAALCDPRE